MDKADCHWDDPHAATRVTLDCGVVDRIRAQVIEAFLSLPRRGAETGGLLLGQVEAREPLRVRVEGFQPIPCEHRFGPAFTLSASDRAGLENSLAGAKEPVVGLYRSYTGREAALEGADRELADAYFAGPQNVFLLLRPLAADRCQASFAWWSGTELSTSEPFSFDSGEMSQLHFGDSLRNPQTAEVSKPVSEISAAPYLPPPVHPRRLYDEETKPTRRKPRFWAPLLAWIALCVGAAFVYEWWHFRRVPARVEPPPAAAKSADRLAPRPTVPPVVPPPATPAEPAPGEVGQQPPAPPHPPRHTEPNYPQAEVAVAPVVIHRVQPGISDGIRSRIRGRVVVPIEVRINASGRVTSAAAEDRGDAVYQYLSGRAAGAARLWRFQPARTRRGRRVASAKTIYFVFTRR